MSNFKKTNAKIYAKPDAVLTPDNEHWKQFGPPVLIKEFGPIDYIDFSSIEPNYFAVSCSCRVQVYSPVTKLVVKNLSRFRENAYGASFRGDGRLLCVGSEEKCVKLFTVHNKNLLRVFKGHTAAVHRAFFTSDNVHIASFSDDKTVQVWDIPTEKSIYKFDEHTDYIRAGCVNQVSKDIILSGSYDHTVKMYDTRSNSTVFTVDHESPVESVMFFPSGGIFVSAGGTEIRVWDSLAGGRLLTRISQHHKTITCLRMLQDGKRFASGSLDRHVKIYDVVSYKPVHTLDFPNGVLSMAFSKNSDTIAVGTVDGLVSVSRREETQKLSKIEKKISSFKNLSDKEVKTVDSVVIHEYRNKEKPYDQCLKKFEYANALDLVLKSNPEVTVSVIQELIRRTVLEKALAGRDPKSISNILRFFIKHITDYRFTRTLVEATNIFLDIYEDSIATFPPSVTNLFMKLTGVLREEEKFQKKLIDLQGAMNLLLAATSTPTTNVDDYMVDFEPSLNAQSNLIINVP